MVEGYTFQQYSTASSTITLWVVGVLEQEHHVEGYSRENIWYYTVRISNCTLIHKTLWKVLKPLNFLLCNVLTANDYMNVAISKIKV